jgi:hypothetical protein
MNLERTEAKNDCAGEGHQQLNLPTDRPTESSSFLNDMLTLVATVFQQIVTGLNGAESEEDTIMAITQIVLKLMKQSDCGSL